MFVPQTIRVQLTQNSSHHILHFMIAFRLTVSVVVELHETTTTLHCSLHQSHLTMLRVDQITNLLARTHEREMVGVYGTEYTSTLRILVVVYAHTLVFLSIFSCTRASSTLSRSSSNFLWASITVSIPRGYKSRDVVDSNWCTPSVAAASLRYAPARTRGKEKCAMTMYKKARRTTSLAVAGTNTVVTARLWRWIWSCTLGVTCLCWRIWSERLSFFRTVLHITFQRKTGR